MWNTVCSFYLCSFCISLQIIWQRLVRHNADAWRTVLQCENLRECEISVVYYTAFMMCVMDKLAMIFYVENTQLHNNDITKSNTAGANCQRVVVRRIAVRTPMAGGGGCSSSCVRVHARSMFCSVLRAAGRQPWRCNGHH